MAGRIVVDVKEFLDILRGKWRKDIMKLLESGQMILPRPGAGPVAITVRRIRIPRLRFMPPPEKADLSEDDGKEGQTGKQDPGDRAIGKGPYKPGTILGPVDKCKGKGKDGEDGEGEEGDDKSAGLGRGNDDIKIEIPAEEVAELLREILELPRIQPKGTKQIETEKWKYTDIRRQGPQSLLHRRRTMKEAMKRTLAGLDPKLGEKKIITPIREDMRYRLPEKIIRPQNNAVIFYKIDVSGSVDEEMRKIIRYFCKLCSFWLSWNYDGLVEEWIIHNGEADRVNREEFFATYRGGGTVISSAHELMLKIVEKEYPPHEWNIYDIYLSDGFNWTDDDEVCKKLLQEKILPIVNLYAYGEVGTNRYWWGGGAAHSGGFSAPGQYGHMLSQSFSEDERVAWAALKEMEQVPEAIKKFFGKGR